MKLILSLCLLLCLAQGDYFGQLPLDKALSTKANQAISDLVKALDTYLDCSLDSKPRSTEGYGKSRYNEIGNFGARWAGQFKKNTGWSPFIFTYPISRNKGVRGPKDSLYIDLYNKLKSVALNLA